MLRVIYFEAAVSLSACLEVAMTKRPTALFGVCVFSPVPLMDAIRPTAISLALLRCLMVLVAAGKAYVIFWCKSDAVRCHDLYEDFTWSIRSAIVSGNATTVNSSSNTTSALEQHIIFSTLDWVIYCAGVRT